MFYKEKWLMQLSIPILLLIPIAAYSANCNVDGKWYPYSSPMCRANSQTDCTSAPEAAQAIADREQFAELRRQLATFDISDIEAEREYLTSISSTGRLSSGISDRLDEEVRLRRTQALAALQAIDNAHNDKLSLIDAMLARIDAREEAAQRASPTGTIKPEVAAMFHKERLAVLNAANCGN